MTDAALPSLVGYAPDDAEEIARAHGWTVAWQDTEPPRWLSPNRELRVIRQQLRDDQVMALLRAWVPLVEMPQEHRMEQSDPSDPPNP